MKKLLILTLISIFGLTFLVLKNTVLAAPTPTPTVNQALLQQLGNEIASKTAQLNLVEKEALSERLRILPTFRLA